MQLPEISRRRALAYVLAVLALLVVGGRFVSGGHSTGTPDALPVAPVAPGPASQSATAGKALVVDVAGAVHRPGLYRLDPGSRIDDALRAAGGPTRRAVLASINLAAPVADGEQVLVPSSTPGTGAAAAAPGAPGSAAGGTVHLNSATLEELDTLPGIGPVTAQKILEYRQAHGAFHSVAELDQVAGIGPARLEELKPLVDL